MSTVVPLASAASELQQIGVKKCFDEPYRIFFPLGILWVLIGVLYWVPVAFGTALEGVPSMVHVYVQVYGFLWSFVVGFLGTAVPRFSGTRWMTRMETLSLLSLSVICMGLLLTQRFAYAHLVFLVSSLVLAGGMGYRVFTRKKEIPATLACIPFALLAAVLGGISLCVTFYGLSVNGAWYVMGKGLLMQGMMLLFLMGVGGFLIKSILHVNVAQGPGVAVQSTQSLRGQWILFSCVSIVVLLSYGIESFLAARTGAVLRAAVVTWVCVWQIGIWRWPRSGKLTAVTLWFGLWLMVVGLWGEAVFSETYRLAFRHLTLMGGFAYSIFAVATRVILSHAGCHALLARRYWPFTTASVLMFIGLITRFSVEFIPMHARHHLGYAAGAWGCGVLVWSATVLPFSFRAMSSSR